MTESTSEGSASEPMVQVKTVDDKIIEVELAVLKRSNVVAHMLQSISPGPEEVIPLNGNENLRADVLEKLFDWCRKNRNRQVEKMGKYDNRVILKDEDIEYLNVDSEFLLSMVMAASFLDISDIVDIITQKIANMANGKSVEELREVYMLEDDLTDAEKKTIREKYSWVDI